MITYIRFFLEFLRYNLKLKKEYLIGHGIGVWMWEYANLKVNGERERILLEFIFNKAKEVAKKENIPIFILPIEEINKEEPDKNKWSGGVYHHIKNGVKKQEHYKNIQEHVEKYYGGLTPPHLIVPRIDLADINKEEEITFEMLTWILIHELGHYFIDKRGGEQSELKANRYVGEFFHYHLPPFFTWAFQIMYHIKMKEERLKFSNWESFLYYKDFMEFTEANKDKNQ